MKKILICITTILIIGCGNKYETASIEKLNSLEPPIILIGKNITECGWEVLVKSENNIVYFNFREGISNIIGSSYAIGDTIIR
jgi:hypothetical protein